MRKWTLGAALLLCLAVGTTGCGDKQQDAGSGDTSSGSGTSTPDTTTTTTPDTTATAEALPGISGGKWLGDAPDMAQGVTAVAFFHPQ